MTKYYILLFSSTLLPQIGFTQEQTCTPWKNHFLSQSNLSIGSITIKAGDIFDLSKPKESTRLHVWTNKLHVETHESTIRQQLLFKQGDHFEQRLLDETERLLRRNRYLKDVTITPTQLCDKQVNIDISTNDKWTLTTGLSFGRSGGNNKSGIEIQEHNLFGLGKSLALSYNKDSERDSVFLGYTDPHLLGSHKRLALSLQDNSDGKAHNLDFGLPFYALDSRYSWGGSTSNIQQENTLYEKGEISKKITQDNEQHSLFYGWSNGLQGNRVKRFRVGWRYRKNHFGKLDNNDSTLDITESYPWLSYESTKDEFIQKTNFKTMGQTEDISIGETFNASVGLLQKQFGSDNNYLLLTSGYAKGYELDDDKLGFIHLKANTYLGSGNLEGEEMILGGSLYTFNETGNSLYFSALITEKSNLLPNEQIRLGGETGLRGYPKAYQTGNKAFVASAEKRFHFNWYPLHIAKFGAVAFADAGTAWGEGSDSKFLADIGVGLRIVPTRSSSAKTIHIDLALPLSERDKVDNVQFLIRTSKSF